MGVTVREKYAGSGEWWVFIYHKGRERSKKVGPRETAEKVAERIRAKIALGEYLPDERKAGAVVFRECAELWLDSVIKPFKRHTTYIRYRGILKNHLYKAFGNRPLAEITRGDIRTWFVKIHRAGTPKATICLYRDVLSGVFGAALDDEIIEVNPVVAVLKRLGLDRERELECTPFTQEESDLILEQCREDYPQYHAFLLCAFRTGMRLGELIGLYWSDIDWNSGRIKVQRSISKQGKETKTKTGRIRWVDMTDELHEVMRIRFIAHKEKSLAAGKVEIEDRIFHRGAGYYSRNSIANVWKNTLRRAGLRYEKFHNIRHSYASQLLSLGVSPVYVKEQLGHSSIEITVDIYGHWMPSGEAKVNLLESRKDRPGPSLYRPGTKGGTTS